MSGGRISLAPRGFEALGWGLAGLWLIAPLACSDNDRNENCMDGQTEVCACPDGSSGQATCSGGVFGSCVCSGSSSSGDVGQMCSPMASGECNFACLGLASGSGVCIDRCGAGTIITCPAPFRCDTRFDASGNPISICLPNSSCGSLSFQGECNGAVLRYCGNEGPIEFDCGQLLGADGSPLGCGLVSPEYGNDCIPAGFTGGCGMETLTGRCEGNTAVFCESAESGRIVRTPCPRGQECGIGPDQQVNCRIPGSAGCGAVTFQGSCEGETLVYCNTNRTEVERIDCAANDRVCGFVDDMVGYDCLEPAMSGGGMGTQTVTGRFLYEKRPLSRQGLGAPSPAPIRLALVQVRSESDNAVLASGATDADGRYSIRYESPGNVYVVILALASDARYDVTVRDCPLQDCGGIGNVYAGRTQAFAPNAPPNLEGVLITEANGAGAFNIFDVFIRGIDFAWASFNQKPPAVTGQWKAGSNTACGTSCFSPSSQTVFILGTARDTDEYDDPVLGHEFGHFLEHAFSRSDSPGGFHDGSPTDPRLAWGEGYGTYVGGEIFGSSVYLDSSASGVSVTDINATGFRARSGDPRGQSQLMSEFVVAEILWKMSKGGASNPSFGSMPIFDVLVGYFPSPSLVDRGVNGVDLVDFLDGWFCRGQGNQSAVRALVTQEMGFPYDYSGPDGCP